MPIKELSQAQITEILSQKLGLRVMPKRPLTIPQVTRETLTGKVKARREGPVLEEVQKLEKFLRMQATDDKFGTDHLARVTAIGEIMEQFGKAANPIIQSYAENNQFRINKLINVPLAIDRMVDRLCDPELAQYFDGLANSTNNSIAGVDTGKFYQDIADTEGKILVVQAVEDAALAALQKLA